MKAKKYPCPYCGETDCVDAYSEVVIPTWVVLLVIGLALTVTICALC